MAPPAGTLRVGRYFAALFALTAVLYGIVFLNEPRTPKLGLDLEGGAQVILKAQTENGKTPSKGAMDQARQIISNRVNGLGVSSAEVVTQGNDRIVVSIPGKGVDSLKDVGTTALLNFRPLMANPVPVTNATPSPSTSSSGTAKPSTSAAPSSSAKPSVTTSAKPATSSASSSPSAHGRVVPLAAGSTTPSPTSSATGSAAASPSASASSGATAPVDQWAKLGFAPPTSAVAYNALPAAQKQAVDAVVAAWPCDNKTKPLDQKNQPLIACDVTNTQKYLLAPVIVEGTEIKSAAALAPGSSQGQVAWEVSLSLKSKGQNAWADYTSKHNEQSNAGDIANQVAFTLDSKVIEASRVTQTINTDTRITGNFDQTSATNLANSLKYGALPLNFTELTNSTVSPTLGTDQLKAGLLAGGIGLALVIIYSLIYYRALGLVTIASLVVSGVLTYAMLVILGNQIGFTLTLAGIAGFIVAVGITADSFVVFFERIKDEVHEGRTSRVAIPRAWERSRRTILSADFVSFLAAAVLYYFAAGEVRGFAFTLGLSTILDLVVVFLFTHPLVSLFSRSAAFGSARFTGLNAVRKPAVAAAQPATEAGPTESPTEPAVAGIGARGASSAKAKPKPKVAGTAPREAADPVAADEPDVLAEPEDTVVSVPSSAAERAAARRARRNSDTTTGKDDR